MFARGFLTRLLLLCAGALAFAAQGARAVTPLGGEFEVNTFTPGVQYFAEVAVAAAGAFVVIWTSRDQDGDAFGVFGQRYDAAGMRQGGEFQVNSYTVGNEMYANLAMEPDGDFVVVWNRRPTVGVADVIGQRFSSSGARLGVEFQVNTTTGGQYYPTVAVDGDGDFVVAWTGDQDGDSSGIFAQRFASSGARVAVEFVVNTYTTSVQRTVAIGMESNGDFVVTWDSQSDGDSSFGVRAQRFGSAGARLGIEFAVNTYTTSGQYGSAVGVAADGDFIVSWTSYGQDGSQSGIFAQRYASSGAKIGVEFLVNSFTTGLQVIPRFYSAPRAVGIDPGGDFVVVWSGASGDVLGQGFASSGVRVGGEFQVNVVTGVNKRATVGMESNGDFVVAWNRDGGDGGLDYAIFARRFTFIRELDVDGNGLVEPLTDGLLVLRRMFGFTGATLIAGVVGGGCTRCDAAAIESYLAGILALLDVDANGSTAALTDGLLILRRLFGFTGATLTFGAIANDCTRCDAGQIASAIDDL